MNSEKDSTHKKIILLIDGHSFDVTSYASQHPGGIKILEKYHNKDATQVFNEIRGHDETFVQDLLEKMEIKPT